MNRKRVTPGPGQESVWDYPRPPRVDQATGHVRVIFNGVVVAETDRARRVLETSHPPAYYIPPEDVKMEHLQSSGRTTWCEWKGLATYYTVSVGDLQVAHAAWSYPGPTPGFEEIKDHIAFYPNHVECYLDGERVLAQEGGFYGGWITQDIVGPFKGGSGTVGW